MINYQLLRELSTLDFNRRVLYQCKLDKNPIGEKFNFLKITTTNLDEFIRVRYSKHVHAKAESIYSKLDTSIRSLYDEIYPVFKELMGELENVQYEEKVTELTEYMINESKRVMRDNLELTTFSLQSDKFYIYFNNEVYLYKSKERFIDISNSPNKIIYVPVEKLLEKYLNTEVIAFRILRDAFIDLNELKDESILSDLRLKLSQRKYNDVMALEYSENTNPMKINKLFKMNTEYLKIPVKVPGLAMCEQMIDELKLNTFNSFKFNKPKVTNKTNIFTALENNDVLLSHPFDSYDTVVKLLETSARDKFTTEIYQTLYRVSSEDSPIVEALCLAAKNKKKVTVVVEIKARFSEETNYKVIDKLKTAGVNIILPTHDYKVHCKAMLIVRGKKMFAHIGTGNYNEKTAELYTDLSLLTSSKSICKDLKRVFKMIEDKKYKGEYDSIVAQPGKIRDTLIKEIDKLIKVASKNKKAIAEIKVNAIADETIINKIYEAASKGVKFKIICRGACVIQRRKNIKICSIVGRYLEHSRIYRFKTKKSDTIYISSADLLTRNLERRVELLCRIDSEETKEKIRMILKAYYKDEMNKFIKTEIGWEPQYGKYSIYKVFKKDLFNETIKIKTTKNKEKEIIDGLAKEIIESVLLSEMYEQHDVV